MTTRETPTMTETPLRIAALADATSVAQPGLTIDCDCCALRDSDACSDCLVTFLLEREPDDAVVIDADEERAVRMLERAGLVPTLRFTSKAG
jgi:hypothetical protein